MTRTQYVRQPDPNGDHRYRVSFEKDQGKILGFVVQLEYRIGQDWVPVVRYDTAHGFAHRDRYAPDGTASLHEPLAFADYQQALTTAIEEVRGNADSWLSGFRRHYHGQK